MHSRTSSVPSTPSSSLSKVASRPPLLTPKRPLSAQSNSSSASADSLAARLARVNTPVLLNSTHKKYKAPLSVESRKNISKPKTTLAPVPGTPAKRDGTPSRPRTPNTPRSRSGAESPSLMPATSEMDVSVVDPEAVLVDSQTVEPGDISGEIDEAWLKAAELDHGKQDKVMVSIRVRPTESTSAWYPTPSTNSLKLNPECARHAASSSAGSNTSFNFDAVLTGSANKPVYTAVARSHVHAAMEGFNAVIFAYGQTASGKTFTLSGDEDEPGIIPRAMRDVFGFIKRTPEREYLLRCSYLEIYNETIVDLLAPPMMAKTSPVQIQGGAGGEIVLAPLREEVVTSLKSVKDVLKRGEGNRRTACTDWNERSSRSHSVFRLVVESRERGSSPPSEDDDDDVPSTMSGRHTPGPNGRHTPGLNGRQTPGLNGRQTPGPRLQARGGRSVQTSVLSLIDLAGSEKATSDKERTREGKYINTSLLTLGTVIGTLADNAAKHKADHVPYRSSKLTRMLQPSLSGNARISVICTINPDVSAISESMSTLLFAKRIKNVQLNAKKKEVVDTDALIERYRKEIEELKARLAEREAEAPVRNRRLSAREQIDESKAMRDLNGRIQQLTKLILTSATVDESKESDSRPSSPVKIDFDMSPYQLQQELLAARLQLETQANQILSLEASLLARPPLPADAPSEEKDKLIAEQAKSIRELEIVVRGYEDNLGEPLRKVKEDVEKEWSEKLEEERRKREEKERWAEEVVKALEKEKQMRKKLEEERRALASFVSMFDSLGLTAIPPSKMNIPMPTPGGAKTAYERRQSRNFSSSSMRSSRLPRISDATVQAEHTGLSQDLTGVAADRDYSPMRLDGLQRARSQPSLMDQAMPEVVLDGVADVSFDEMEVENQLLDVSTCVPDSGVPMKMFGIAALDKFGAVKTRDVFGDKENILPA